MPQTGKRSHTLRKDEKTFLESSAASRTPDKEKMQRFSKTAALRPATGSALCLATGEKDTHAKKHGTHHLDKKNTFYAGVFAMERVSASRTPGTAWNFDR